MIRREGLRQQWRKSQEYQRQKALNPQRYDDAYTPVVASNDGLRTSSVREIPSGTFLKKEPEYLSPIPKRTKKKMSHNQNNYQCEKYDTGKYFNVEKFKEQERKAREHQARIEEY